MKFELLIVVVGVFFTFEGISGRPNDHTCVEKELLSMSEGLAGPILKKAQDADTTLAKVLEDYNSKMAALNALLASPSSVDSSPIKEELDSCHELKDSMDQAHSIADHAAVLAVLFTGEMSGVVLSTKDCLSINIFSTVSCSAHKLKDGKYVYLKYKQEIDQVEGELGDAMKKVYSELVNCFRKINS